MLKLNQILVGVSDLSQSIDFYRGLGLHLIVQTETYARFIVPGNEATFSLSYIEKVNPSEIEVCFEIEFLDEYVSDLISKGYEFIQLPTDQTWLWREARLHDPDGNKLLLYFAGENRLNPPWRLQDDVID